MTSNKPYVVIRLAQRGGLCEPRLEPMRYMRGLALLVMLFPGTLMAANDTQTIWPRLSEPKTHNCLAEYAKCRGTQHRDRGYG
jgi:hypothetical protein